MSKPRVPSLQHFARNWHSDPQRVRKDLFDVATNGPTISYQPLFKLLRQRLAFGDDYHQLVKCISLVEKRPSVRQDFIDAFTLLYDYFANIRPSFIKTCTGRFYPISRDLLVPFSPPLIYGIDGRLVFPWISFWKRNPLGGERLSLSVTLVGELLLEDPDLDGAAFEIIDLSAEGSKGGRTLKIISSNEVPRVSPSRKIEMLDVFAKGYLLAKQDVALGMKREAAATVAGDVRQLILL